jgi:uncharacterized protein
MTRWSFSCLVVLLATPIAPAQPPAVPRFPDPPDRGEFVLDLAGVLTPGDRQQIRSTAGRLLAEEGTPLLVVTVTALADYQPAGRGADEFACRMLTAWREEHPETYGPAWRRAVLLLVSRGDRQVRIELAPAWAHQKDAACRGILDDVVLPALRRDDYSTGVRAGVGALDRLVRGAPQAGAAALPRPSAPPDRPPSHPDSGGGWLLVLGAGLGLVVVLVLIAAHHDGRPPGGPRPGSGGSGGSGGRGGGWFQGSVWSGGDTGGGSCGGFGGGDGGCSGGGASGSF